MISECIRPRYKKYEKKGECVVIPCWNYHTRKYMGELKQHQPSMSIDEQVENLKSLEFICRPNRSINREV